MDDLRPSSRCPPEPKLDERPLLTGEQAAGLMDLFKSLANDTRLRLLHALARVGELCVGDLAEAVGMRPQAVSNQLQRLVDRGVLGSRRDGRSIRYRIVDPCVTGLLDLGLCLAEDSETRRGASRVASPAAGPPSPGAGRSSRRRKEPVP
jgi:ArsR family transcriptional regulator, lead/cadmium/zinc/bismuth-responsive transcriptional repressor